MRRLLALATGLALLLPPGAAAQLTFDSFDRSELDTFDKLFSGNLQWGRGSGTTGDWELALWNPATNRPFSGTERQFSWTNSPRPFSFTYDPGGLYQGVLNVGGASGVHTRTSDIGPFDANQLVIWQRAGDGRTALLENVAVRLLGSDEVFASAVSLAGTPDGFLWDIFSEELRDGFVMTGDVTLYGGSSTNNDPNIAFKVGRGTAQIVPEPTTLLLFGTGLVGMAGAATRRKRRLDAVEDEAP